MRENRLAGKLEKARELAARLEGEIREAGEMSLYDGESMLPYRYACEAVVNAAWTAEKTTGLVRELVAEMVVDSKLYSKYQDGLVSIHGIQIRYEKDVVAVKLPALMPHRKGKYTEYLAGPLVAALQGWCAQRREAGETVPVFARAALCFVHRYGPGAQVRDHDNVEAKQVQDVLALFFLQADDGLHLDLYHTSEEGGESCTWLYLMGHESFSGWLAERGCRDAEKYRNMQRK